MLGSELLGLDRKSHGRKHGGAASPWGGSINNMGTAIKATLRGKIKPPLPGTHQSATEVEDVRRIHEELQGNKGK